MKELYRRFNINVSLVDSQNKFVNKINNVLFCETSPDYKQFNSGDLSWSLCNKLGLEYLKYELPGLETYLQQIPFFDYLLRIQCILIILWERKEYLKQYNLLTDIINKAINDSPFDLGIRLKYSKTKVVQIIPSGAPLLDQKLVDDVLGVLDGKDKNAIKTAFEKGLKEFSESLKDKNKVKNVVRDMQLACDEVVKFLFNEKNLGFKHVFNDNRAEKIGLNKYQTQVFYNLNEYIDKMAKHKADSEISIEDAEYVIYLTGIFIRLTLLKNRR